MFRNQYDSDNTTWSPQGRIFQVEYAMEAVKQGSVCVGLKSNSYAIVAGLKRFSNDLASSQQKIFVVDDHAGFAMAGLTADARVLSKFMRTECISHRFVYDSPMQVNRLVSKISDKAQISTQRYGRRPYGVGLLIVGYDATGTHLYETCPSGNCYDYIAQAIGGRSQSARTYLEKSFKDYANASKDELIKHALLALRETCGSQSEGLTTNNTAIGIVGVDQKFHIIEHDELKPYLEGIDDEDKEKAEAMES